MTEPTTEVATDLERFRDPSREFGILPFWFLNGELDPDEMRFQLRELRDKGMHGVILHGRYGLEIPYLSEAYLDRIRLAAAAAAELGLATWIYDEMNWPSGTADKRVLRERPDLVERYIECVTFTIEGPWFMCLTGEDSRYLDFQRSTPVAAFAMGEDGRIVDLTPNLSFEKVVPWEVPPGRWRLCYVVEKRAEYYIDALDPDSTATFLRLGYEPYVRAVEGDGARLVGFYSDEPAMHYFLSAGDNPVVPWTKDMFRRFRERNGYDLRPRLADLFFDIRPDAARTRYDYYSTTTEFYSDAYYRQIHQWCRRRGLRFTAHLLYEEWLRRLVRVEGNLFKHYANMDVVAVDHLYPIIGTRDQPDQHVAMKVASSAAHHYGSERLICESFGGIFMDATMQRMKWIADWEYVLGVNLLNPHGFHYTLEGPRKRDWPPSQFYHYPWWDHYGLFSAYIARASETLSGGSHVAKVAVLWPINAMFAEYRPQERTALGDRIEGDFNALTDLLLRLHFDYDYLDEDVLAEADVGGGVVRVRDESYELVLVPPMGHLKLETVERLERFVRSGGRVLGAVVLPGIAFGPEGPVDVSDRMRALFGVDPTPVDRLGEVEGVERVDTEHEGGGRTAFLRAPRILGADGTSDGDRAVVEALRGALGSLIEPDVVIDNEDVFYLHRRKAGQDVYFVVNATFQEQVAEVRLPGEVDPVLWDPSTGAERILASRVKDRRTVVSLALPPVGSAFLVPRPVDRPRVLETTITVEAVSAAEIRGHGPDGTAEVLIRRDGREHRLARTSPAPPEPLVLDGAWGFAPEQPNALVLDRWVAAVEEAGMPEGAYAGRQAEGEWVEVVPGAWSYQVPGGPSGPYPVPVWYRISFRADHVPDSAALVVDGFAGDGHRLFLNGSPVTSRPERAPFDSQMKVVDLAGLIQAGENVLAVRLPLRGPTDGLLDRMRLLGPFGLLAEGGSWRLVEPPETILPESWTDQGFPFLSGHGWYRRSFDLPDAFAGCRLFLEVPMRDDVLDVRVNDGPAGVRLWDPYTVEVTDLLRPGANTVELRVANTPANLIDGVRRPSGLAGPPRLVAHQPFRLEIPPG